MAIIRGQHFDLDLDFPLSQGVLVRCRLLDKSGSELETWQKPIDPTAWQKWGPWSGIAERFIRDLFRSGPR